MVKKKVLLMGKAHSGKTSMRSIIFANYLAKDTQRLSPTLDVEHHSVRFLNDLHLNLWDCGGQDSFYENYFERDRESIFRCVELLIYVFDIESSQPEIDFNHFCGVLEALEENSPDANIFILIHKMDLVSDDDRTSIFEDRKRLINESYNMCGITTPFHCYGTSIWDETLYKAWSDIVTNLIPNITILEKHLSAFCTSCDADEIVLFERATFLVISHAQQQQQEEEFEFGGEQQLENDDDDDSMLEDEYNNDHDDDDDHEAQKQQQGEESDEKQRSGSHINDDDDEEKITVGGEDDDGQHNSTQDIRDVDGDVNMNNNDIRLVVEEEASNDDAYEDNDKKKKKKKDPSEQREGPSFSGVNSKKKKKKKITSTITRSTITNDNNNTTMNANTNRIRHFDPHRFEKISNIIKQFKLSCGKAQSQFQGMEVRNTRFVAYIDIFTTNTYIMVVISDPNILCTSSSLSIITQQNIQNAKRHFEQFIPRI